MSGTLVLGKGFRFEKTLLSTGETYDEIFGIDGDHMGISWSSVRAMMTTAAHHGVSEDLWPVYPDCELDRDVPLGDVHIKSAQLRSALDQIPTDIVAQDYWLRFIAQILREEYSSSSWRSDSWVPCGPSDLSEQRTKIIMQTKLQHRRRQARPNYPDRARAVGQSQIYSKPVVPSSSTTSKKEAIMSSARDSNPVHHLQVYVKLLGEGTPVFRLSTAEFLPSGLVRLLEPPSYDPEDEDWEFKPGSVVRIELRQLEGIEVHVAVDIAA